MSAERPPEAVASPDCGPVCDPPNVTGGLPGLVMVLPDGVGVRNFVLGPFLSLASEAFQPRILWGFPADMAPAELDGIQWLEMYKYRETALLKLLRYSLAYAHMYHWNTVGMRAVLGEKVRRNWRSEALHRSGRLFGRAQASLRGIERLQKALWSRVADTALVDRYVELFRRMRPAVVMCSHQRPPISLPAMVAARRLGIPTATFIFSWDNLSSKGRIAAPFDYFLVWSELMKRELLSFYPDVSPDQVYVVGTPQFDPYADPALKWTREEFCAHLGADPTRPLICYSGGDRRVCPQGPEQLETVLELLRGGRIGGKPQLIFRSTPTEDGSRYSEVRRRYPELIFAQPQWRHASSGGWHEALPTHQDVRFLVNLVAHSDVNINVSSTMTLDFAIHDKPVVNLAYDVGDRRPFGVPLWEFHYQFEHYQPVLKLGAARVARTPEELAQHVNAYLSDPTLDRDGRADFVKLEVGVPIGRSSQAVVEALQDIVRSGTSSGVKGAAPLRV